jgi:cytochrome P450
VLFKSPEAYEAIYRPRANLMRSTFYQIFLRNKEDYSTLTTIEPKPHAEKRRLLSLAFTDRSIKAAGNFIIEHVDRWNELLSVGKEWSEPVDISDRLQHLVFDVLGDLCFGKNFQTKEPDRSNPLKIIPTVITKYMKFQYSVCRGVLLLVDIR